MKKEKMTPTVQELFNRKSVRKYTDVSISDPDKRLIINAAIQAPTAGNQTLYTILDITDQEIKDTLAVTCDHQPFIAKAPMVLIFLADCRKWYDSYRLAGAEPRKPGVGDLMLSCLDAVIAAHNAVVAAESMGIGSCYIGDILENIEQHRELLQLDKYVFPVAMLVFGYPTEKQKTRTKPPRFDARFIVQSNVYSRPDEDTLRQMFEDRHQKESFHFEEYLQAFCKRKYMSDFSLEMTRSVAEYLKDFQE